MMKKTLIALLTTVALSTSACAAEEQSSVTKTAQTTAQATVKTATASLNTGFNAPADAWRELDPENTLYIDLEYGCLLYTSPSPRDATLSRMPSSA